MKTIFYILTFFAFLSCSKDNITSAISLPPETQTGANTFGVTIKGKVYVPRDPTGVNIGPSGHGVTIWAAPDLTSWEEIEIKDGKSAVGFQMYIHMQRISSIGQIILHQSNYHNGIDSVPYSNIFFKMWDSAISNYAYYGSVENQSILNITRLDSGILSGNFSGKFVCYDNPTDFITITDGRFDINTFTIENAVFP